MKFNFEAARAYFFQCTINGMNYVCDKNRRRTPKSHRVGWSLMLFLSCIMCVWLSLSIRNTFINMHTITSIASSSHHVSQIPFPCISICNVNKVSRKNFQIIKKLLLIHDIEEEETELFGESLSSLITFSSFDYIPREIQDHREIFDILKAHDYGVDNLMKTLQQDCSRFLVRCILQSISVNCTDYFSMIKTNEGYCCGFNYRGPESFGDTNELDFHEPDEQIYLTGYQAFGGMTVILDFEMDDYMSPVRPYYGGSVLINDATDFPESSVKATTLQPQKPTVIEMKPWLIESTKEVGYLPEETRKCQFNDGAGTTNTFYSYNSCLSKCRSLLMFKYCGCIPFFYPPIGLDQRRKCIFSDNKCLNRFKAIFFSQATQTSRGMKCKCMPECTDRFYDINRKPGKLNHSIYADVLNSDELKEKNVTLLSVFYSRMTCNRLLLDVFMHWNDSFGFYGGLMSLFIGGSILSLIEILAFVFFHYFKKLFKKPEQKSRVMTLDEWFMCEFVE